jgi:6-phosphogluconolactonase
MNLEILAGPADLANTAAELFVAKSTEAVAQRGFFTIALSGGSTPKLLYQFLAYKQFRPEIPWPMIHFFWTDERHVPPDDPDSNYRMAYELLLSRVPVAEHNVHRIKSENPNAAEAAKEYEEEILTFVPGSPPQLDLILLGLGNDGHTASIFPGSDVLHESQRLVAASYVDKLKSYRITMTLPLINNAASIVFLVSGVEKAEIVKEVIQGTKRYPAQEIRPTNGELVWLLDREAASKL